MSEDAQDKPTTVKTPEPAKKPSAAAHRQHRKSATPRNSFAYFLALTSLIVSLAVAAGGYYLWQQQEESSRHDLANFERLGRDQRKLDEALEKLHSSLNEGLAGMRQSQSDLKQDLSALLDRSSHLKNDWLVSEAEYLIRLANHRLLLDRDVRTALLALNTADQRLRETGDPLLIPVRKTLASDMQALKSIEQADITGLSLQLTALSQQADKLPLKTPDPQSAATSTAPIAEQPAENWWDKISGVWKVLGDLIVIRQHDEPVQPLMPPEQRYFLVQNLKLKLEQARIALLRNEASVFTDNLRQSRQWIQRFFDTDNPATRSVVESLKTISEQKIAPDLPDITRSLKALKNYRNPPKTQPKAPSTPVESST